MNQNNTNSVISILDLFAYLVRKAWILIIGALICAVLFVSYNTIAVRRTSEPERNHVAERTLENLKAKLSLMDEVSKTGIVFTESDLYSSKFSIILNPDYPIDKYNNAEALVSELNSIWKDMDVSSMVGSEKSSDYLKLSMDLAVSGTTAEIIVFSDSESDSNRVANIIRDEFSTYYEGKLIMKALLGRVSTSKASISDIDKYLKDFSKEKASVQKEIDTTLALIPVPAKLQIVKYSILGFICGLFISVLGLMLSFVSRNPLTSSFSVERNLSMIFMGTMFISNDFFSKLARRIVGERCFRDKEEEKKYIKSHFDNDSFVDSKMIKKIVVLSSSSDKRAQNIVQDVCKTISALGFEVSSVTNSTNSSCTISSVGNADAVIIMEKQWESKYQLMKENRDVAEKMKKRVLGFILC